MLKAQAPDLVRTICRDTINLRGRVIDAGGRPVPGIEVHSSGENLKYPKIFLGALTDSMGVFRIEGALFNDTITVVSAGRDMPKYYNRGSRFITIQLPLILPRQLSAGISARRFVATRKPCFTTEPEDYTCMLSYATNASLVGGEQMLQKIVSSRLIYPAKAIKNNIEGTVRVAFTVEKDGSTSNFSVLDSIGYGCEEEAIRVLRTMPKWSPAMRGGKAIKSQQTAAITFRLED
ncbi:TonB family protein [Arcticibacter sp. MXS-1]|uniref:TonB family protein n=1 Tax=Arcticibacter sp. MXS-1 TaxID=3341726 RepID=UPI0035A892FD